MARMILNAYCRLLLLSVALRFDAQCLEGGLWVPCDPDGG